MAHLLGSRYCIESLRNDVTDLQASIVDVFSRTGPVQSPSWKYPDKIAADLDLTDLLEVYDWSEDEEERQVAHISLLELLIDRLLLLLLSVSHHMKLIRIKLSEGSSSSPTNEPAPTSAGLVVKKFWNELLAISKKLTLLHGENKKKSSEISQLKSQLDGVQEGYEHMKTEALLSSALSDLPIPLNAADSRAALEILSPESRCISRDEYNKASQTYETAFVPCESCDLVQTDLRAMGSVLIDFCLSHGLPSSLHKHASLVSGGDWMNGSDIQRWISVQNKDFVRITKHLESVQNDMSSLRDDMDKELKEKEELQAQLSKLQKDLRYEKQTKFTQRKHYEGRIEKLQAEQTDQMNEYKLQRESLQTQMEEQAKVIDGLTAKVEEQKGLYMELLCQKDNLETEIKEEMQKSGLVAQMQSNITGLEAQLKQTQSKLTALEKEKNMERARSKNASMHSQALQSKQENLLERLDELASENEELRTEISQLEDEVSSLKESLEEREKSKLLAERQLKENQETISDLGRDLSRLKDDRMSTEKELEEVKMKLEKLASEQKLMVEYPDLNGPVNPNISGTGDILRDMENQVEANSLRIKILEEQNSILRRSISKLLQAQKADSSSLSQMSMAGEPVPLWKVQQSTVTNGQHLESSSSPDSYLDAEPQKEVRDPRNEEDAMFVRTNNFPVTHKPKRMQPLPPRPPSGKKALDTHVVQYENFVQSLGKKETGKSNRRAGSGGSGKNDARKESGSASSISAYIKLKNAGILRPKSGKNRSPTGNEDYAAQEVFSCYKCDKMYNSKADLEVHKSYCFGAL